MCQFAIFVVREKNPLPMNHAAASEPSAGRLLIRIVELLARDLQTSAFALKDPHGQILFETGLDGQTDTTNIPISGYELILAKPFSELSAEDRVTLRSARELVKSLLPKIRAAQDGNLGSISFLTLADIYLQALKALETRSTLLENYERILQLNDRILLADGLDQVLQIIMDMAAEAIGGESSSLLLVDTRTGEMYFNVVSGDHSQKLKEIRIPAGRGIAGSVVLSGRGEIIKDVSADERAYSAVDRRLQQQTRNMAVAPLIAHGQVIGVIEVINSIAQDGFSEEDLEFLNNIAAQSALLLENARAKEDLVRSNRELDKRVSEVHALYEIGKTLNSSLNSEELRVNLLRSMMKLLRIEHGAILLHDRSARRLLQESTIQLTAAGMKESKNVAVFEDVTDLMLWMKQNREPMLFQSGNENTESGILKRFRDTNRTLFTGERAPALWIPVCEDNSGEVSFILSLTSGQSGAGETADLVFYRSVMNQADAAFRNVRVHHDAVESRKREEHIRTTFQRYVPEQVIGSVLQGPQNARAEIRNVTILFADIRGFTRLAEILEPEQVLDLVNEYFEAMEPAIDRYGGIIDKFMGDSIMAVFGIPEPGPNDAANAVEAARDMHGRLGLLNEKRRLENRPAFRMGMGLHSGPVVSGHIGAHRRQDYTVLGDSVNLAARLEKLAKLYSCEVLLTEATLKESGTERAVRETDLLLVRGRVEPTRVFELVEDGPVSAQLGLWSQALDFYRAADFDASIQSFEAFKQAVPGDPLVELYLRRCADFKMRPPPADWDGVFRVDV